MQNYRLVLASCVRVSLVAEERVDGVAEGVLRLQTAKGGLLINVATVPPASRGTRSTGAKTVKMAK